MSSGIEEESIVIAIIASFSSAKSKVKTTEKERFHRSTTTYTRKTIAVLSLNAMLYEVNVEIFH